MLWAVETMFLDTR